MDDYIKREDVEKVLRDAHINRPLDSDRWVIAQMSEGVAKIPAADVRENVRAKWVENRACDCVCQHCGYEALRFYGGKQCKSDYCPNCGADMRGINDV